MSASASGAGLVDDEPGVVPPADDVAAVAESDDGGDESDEDTGSHVDAEGPGVADVAALSQDVRSLGYVQHGADETQETCKDKDVVVINAEWCMAARPQLRMALNGARARAQTHTHTHTHTHTYHCYKCGQSSASSTVH